MALFESDKTDRLMETVEKVEFSLVSFGQFLLQTNHPSHLTNPYSQGHWDAENRRCVSHLSL